jgi:hypothetical protein
VTADDRLLPLGRRLLADGSTFHGDEDLKQ